jgi:tetratricopeptide (TPR) repeat protein
MISELLGEVLRNHTLSQRTLQRFIREFPSSYSAMEAMAVGESEHLANEAIGLIERPGWLLKRSISLIALGQLGDALGLISEAVSIYRQFAETHPDTYLPRLAGALNSQSRCLTDLGARDQALTCISEAVSIYQQFAEDDPDTYLPALEAGIASLIGLQIMLGQYPEVAIHTTISADLSS